MPESPGRALGLDVGSRRLGVAISDSDQRVATPLEVVPYADRAAGRLRVGELVDEWEVALVVVGLPLHLNGVAGAAVKMVNSEIEALRATIAMPFVTYDERLSTVTAHRSLAEQSVAAKNRRNVVDMVAAAVILQGWMDMHS